MFQWTVKNKYVSCARLTKPLLLLLQLDNWSTFDVFKVARLSHGKPLQKVTLALLDHFDLVGKLQLERMKVTSFLQVGHCKKTRSIVLRAESSTIVWTASLLYLYLYLSKA